VKDTGDAGQSLRVLKPNAVTYAFYDGRIEDRRLFSSAANWLDDGAFSLGTASFAIVDEDEALLYDAHITPAHARRIRAFIEALGIRNMRLIVSHRHLDHVAGNQVFADCEIIANRRTAELLTKHRSAIEQGRHRGQPAIVPLVVPNSVFDVSRRLRVGRIDVDLEHLNIHSDDATVMLVPELELLFAGDTLEDTVTYVAEPKELGTHLGDLDRMWKWSVARILPNHGDPAIIGGGGYPRSLIRATQQYVRTLQRCRSEAELRSLDLKDFIAGPLQAGWVHYFAPYERVHQANVEAVVAAQ
jgi:glyoxylase-like metal-dependent hydrolase (beta-lactamase superfamily II)